MDKTQRLKLFIKAVPEKGKANQEVIHLVALAAKVPTSAVTILKGATSQVKIVKIDTLLTMEQFFTNIGLAVQQKLGEVLD